MSATDHIIDAVARHLDTDDADKWLIAFSGGPDSSVLAWAFSELSRRPELIARQLDVVLAHIDHGLDADSAQRASQAESLAQRLGLKIVVERLEGQSRPVGSSLEAWAREKRYDRLHDLAQRLGLERIATAHHADDQAETVLMRLAFGSGLFGLAGIRRRHGRVARPLLNLRRRQVLAALESVGLQAIEDPTNRDLTRPRNRIRHLILPEWQEQRADLVENLNRLSQRAARAFERLDAFFVESLHIESLPNGGSHLDRRALAILPPDMLPFPLGTLERVAGKPLPSPASARAELRRQLQTTGRVGCDAGAGWRWQADSRSLRLLPPHKPLARFTYTVNVPGSVFVTETGTLLRITGAPIERPAVADQASTAYLRPLSSACHHLEIRNRRPGDRLQPAGRQRERRLKEVLIDQRIPRDQRDRLPLVVIEGQVAWVPGVALNERFCARDGEPAWLVEVLNTPAGDLIDDKR